MNTTELKTSLHKIVDRIEDERLLMSVYDFLKVREAEKTGRLWDTLSEEQKKEVLLSYEESENEENLISKEEFFRNAP